MSPLVPFSAAAAPPITTPSLQISAPKQVKVGDPIEFQLAVQGGNGVAAFEAAVLFDPSAAEFDNWQVATNSVHALGRDVGELAAPETSYGAAIGFYSCPVTTCVDNRSPRHGNGAAGNVNLGTLTLIGDESGTLVVTFDAVKVVDANGNTLPLNVPNPTLTIQVGPSSGGPAPSAASPTPPGTATSGTASPAVGGRGSVHPAPASRWSLPAHGKGTLGPFSTTGTGAVANADVMEVAMAWEDLRARSDGNPCGTGVDPRLDVNHDGCLDVADLEAVAAHYGPTNTSRIETPAAGVQTATPATAGAIFVVNSTGDEDDAHKGDGVCLTAVGTCTLRAAIAEANNDPGPQEIDFNIPGTGVQTIQLTSALPSLWDTTGGTTINGSTQPGSAVNTAPLADNAKIMVQVQGGGYTNYDCLKITSANNVIQGLSLFNFHKTLWFYGPGATGNVVVGDFVGTNASGTAHATALGDSEAHGIKIEQGAAHTTIGKPDLADRNVISGNGRSGVGIWHNGSNNEVIQNNIVGLSPDGTRRLSNELQGVDMNFGTQHDLVGGTGQYEHNVSSGNNYNGIDLSHDPSTTHNSVIGNYIGTALDGNSSPGYTYNLRFGIRVKDGVTANTIADNVIGGMNNHVSDGNGNAGIVIEIAGTTGIPSQNTVSGNRIGISLNGTPMPNSWGILVIDGTSNTIGPNNLIADNAGPGIEVQAGTGMTITQNAIYGNKGPGIKLDSGANNGIAVPTLTSASTTAVSGTACASCTVEVFVADGQVGNAGEGETYVGSGTADGSGAFTAPVSGVNAGEVITATATDAQGDTSQFALNIQVGGSSPPPAITLPGHFEVEAYNPGGEGIGYHDTTTGNSGNAKIRNDDVDIQTCTDPTTPSGQTCYNVGWTAAGEWLAYNVNITNAGTYTFAIRVASPNNGESLHFEVDGVDVTGSIAIPNTGGWQTWQTVTSNPASLPAGTHTLKLVEDTGGYNLNYIDVAAVVVPPPAAPTNLVANPVSSTEIDLSWTDNASNETAYDVERSLDGTNFTPLNANLPANTTSYDDTGLNPSTHYYYQVRATTSGGASTYATVDATTQATPPPAPPTNLVANPVSSSEIDLSWADNATNETAYDVERSLDSINWTVVNANLPANTTSYADKGLTASTHYYYQVQATNGSGGSGYVNVDTSTLPASDTINLPGRIEAENYRVGGEGVGYHDTTPGNTGGADRTDDVDIQTCTDSATTPGASCYNVGWIASGEWLAYDVNVATAGNYSFVARVATPNTGGSFHLMLDGAAITSPITVPNTGGNQTWVSVGVPSVALPAGPHTLTVFFDSGGFNLDFIDVAPDESGQSIALPGHFELEDYASGGEGVGYHDTTPGNSGGAYRNDDVDIQPCADPSTPSGQTCYNVGWTAAGEWLAYNVNISTSGNYIFSIRVASPNNREKLHLELDGTNVTGSIAVPNTGGWQIWQTVTTGPIALPSGTHLLKLVEDTGGYNLNYIDVAASP